MSRFFLPAFLLSGFISVPFAFSAAPPLPELVIYTYDSLVAKHGLGPEIFPLFEKQCGCKVRALASGDGGQLLNRLQLDAERHRPAAQVVLGLDQTVWERAKPWLETSEDWEPEGMRELLPQLRVGKGFVPFDYGVFAFMADREALTASHLSEPKRLSDLLKPEWRRNLILEDPRTSTPGLAFLLYVNAVTGKGAAQFWQRFKSQWLTLAPGWDGAYGLFLKKEAPLVWSYTTSQAYHEAHGDRGDEKRRYQALVFEEGQPIQVEGAALVKDGALSPVRRNLARSFLEFLLSQDVQSRIPLRNWMFPVRRGVALPEAFKNVPQPKLLVKTEVSAAEIDEALGRWKRALESTR